LTRAYTNLFPNMTSASIPVVTMLRSSLSMNVIFVYDKKFFCHCLFCYQFTRGYFVNSPHVSGLFRLLLIPKTCFSPMRLSSGVCTWRGKFIHIQFIYVKTCILKSESQISIKYYNQCCVMLFMLSHTHFQTVLNHSTIWPPEQLSQKASWHSRIQSHTSCPTYLTVHHFVILIKIQWRVKMMKLLIMWFFFNLLLLPFLYVQISRTFFSVNLNLHSSFRVRDHAYPYTTGKIIVIYCISWFLHL
jgi:hypothetical protein